jgi:multiple sugar transport system permease protein
MPLGLAQAVGHRGRRLHRMMAASIHAMLPTALLVLLLQEHLVRELLVTGLGGMLRPVRNPTDTESLRNHTDP